MAWNKKAIVSLICINLSLTGSYALINLPAPLEWILMKVFNIDTSSFGVLVSLSSWASLLDIIHGYLLDRYLGVVTATFIYSAVTIIGCSLYTVASYIKLFWLFILGRTIFGLGVNPIILLVNKHILIWFGNGKHINFAYSLSESIIWLGSSVVFLISSPILDCFNGTYFEDVAFSNTVLSETVLFTVVTIVPTIICALMYKYRNKDDLKESNETNKQSSQDKKLVLKDYICLPIKFWIFSISIFLFYVSILSFISMSQLFLVSRYGLTSNYASTLSGLISLIPSLISPFYGIILDRIGHNLTSLTVAIILGGIGQALFAFTMCNPLIPVVVMGLSLVLVSGIWSQFQFLVEDHQYMIAYGVAQTGLNGAQAAGTIISGYIIDSHGYDGFINFLFIVIICAAPTVAIVWILDFRQEFFLNQTSLQKASILGRLKESSDRNRGTNGLNNEGFVLDLNER